MDSEMFQFTCVYMDECIFDPVPRSLQAGYNIHKYCADNMYSTSRYLKRAVYKLYTSYRLEDETTISMTSTNRRIRSALSCQSELLKDATLYEILETGLMNQLFFGHLFKISNLLITKSDAHVLLDYVRFFHRFIGRCHVKGVAINFFTTDMLRSQQVLNNLSSFNTDALFGTEISHFMLNLASRPIENMVDVQIALVSSEIVSLFDSKFRVVKREPVVKGYNFDLVYEYITTISVVFHKVVSFLLESKGSNNIHIDHKDLYQMRSHFNKVLQALSGLLDFLYTQFVTTEEEETKGETLGVVSAKIDSLCPEWRLGDGPKVPGSTQINIPDRPKLNFLHQMSQNLNLYRLVVSLNSYIKALLFPEGWRNANMSTKETISSSGVLNLLSGQGIITVADFSLFIVNKTLINLAPPAVPGLTDMDRERRVALSVEAFPYKLDVKRKLRVVATFIRVAVRHEKYFTSLLSSPASTGLLGSVVARLTQFYARLKDAILSRADPKLVASFMHSTLDALGCTGIINGLVDKAFLSLSSTSTSRPPPTSPFQKPKAALPKLVRLLERVAVDLQRLVPFADPSLISQVLLLASRSLSLLNHILTHLHTLGATTQMYSLYARTSFKITLHYRIIYRVARALLSIDAFIRSFLSLGKPSARSASDTTSIPILVEIRSLIISLSDELMASIPILVSNLSVHKSTNLFLYEYFTTNNANLIAVVLLALIRFVHLRKEFASLQLPSVTVEPDSDKGIDVPGLFCAISSFALSDTVCMDLAIDLIQSLSKAHLLGDGSMRINIALSLGLADRQIDKLEARWSLESITSIVIEDFLPLRSPVTLLKNKIVQMLDMLAAARAKVDGGEGEGDRPEPVVDQPEDPSEQDPAEMVDDIIACTRAIGGFLDGLSVRRYRWELGSLYIRFVLCLLGHLITLDFISYTNLTDVLHILRNALCVLQLHNLDFGPRCDVRLLIRGLIARQMTAITCAYIEEVNTNCAYILRINSTEHKKASKQTKDGSNDEGNENSNQESSKELTENHIKGKTSSSHKTDEGVAPEEEDIEEDKDEEEEEEESDESQEPFKPETEEISSLLTELLNEDQLETVQLMLDIVSDFGLHEHYHDLRNTNAKLRHALHHNLYLALNDSSDAACSTAPLESKMFKDHNETVNSGKASARGSPSSVAGTATPFSPSAPSSTIQPSSPCSPMAEDSRLAILSKHQADYILQAKAFVANIAAFALHLSRFCPALSPASPPSRINGLMNTCVRILLSNSTSRSRIQNGVGNKLKSFLTESLRRPAKEALESLRLTLCTNNDTLVAPSHSQQPDTISSTLGGDLEATVIPLKGDTSQPLKPQPSFYEKVRVVLDNALITRQPLRTLSIEVLMNGIMLEAGRSEDDLSGYVDCFSSLVNYLSVFGVHSFLMERFVAHSIDVFFFINQLIQHHLATQSAQQQSVLPKQRLVDVPTLDLDAEFPSIHLEAYKLPKIFEGVLTLIYRFRLSLPAIYKERHKLQRTLLLELENSRPRGADDRLWLYSLIFKIFFKLMYMIGGPATHPGLALALAPSLTGLTPLSQAQQQELLKVLAYLQNSTNILAICSSVIPTSTYSLSIDSVLRLVSVYYGLNKVGPGAPQNKYKFYISLTLLKSVVNLMTSNSLSLRNDRLCRSIVLDNAIYKYFIVRGVQPVISPQDRSEDRNYIQFYYNGVLHRFTILQDALLGILSQPRPESVKKIYTGVLKNILSTAFCFTKTETCRYSLGNWFITKNITNLTFTPALLSSVLKRLIIRDAVAPDVLGHYVLYLANCETSRVLFTRYLFILARVGVGATLSPSKTRDITTRIYSIFNIATFKFLLPVRPSVAQSIEFSILAALLISVFGLDAVDDNIEFETNGELFGGTTISTGSRAGFDTTVVAKNIEMDQEIDLDLVPDPDGEGTCGTGRASSCHSRDYSTTDTEYATGSTFLSTQGTFFLNRPSEVSVYTKHLETFIEALTDGSQLSPNAAQYGTALNSVILMLLFFNGSRKLMTKRHGPRILSTVANHFPTAFLCSSLMETLEKMKNGTSDKGQNIQYVGVLLSVIHNICALLMTLVASQGVDSDASPFASSQTSTSINATNLQALHTSLSTVFGDNKVGDTLNGIGISEHRKKEGKWLKHSLETNNMIVSKLRTLAFRLRCLGTASSGFLLNSLTETAANTSVGSCANPESVEAQEPSPHSLLPGTTTKTDNGFQYADRMTSVIIPPSDNLLHNVSKKLLGNSESCEISADMISDTLGGDAEQTVLTLCAAQGLQLPARRKGYLSNTEFLLANMDNMSTSDKVPTLNKDCANTSHATDFQSLNELKIPCDEIPDIPMPTSQAIASLKVQFAVSQSAGEDTAVTKGSVNVGCTSTIAEQDDESDSISSKEIKIVEPLDISGSIECSPLLRSGQEKGFATPVIQQQRNAIPSDGVSMSISYDDQPEEINATLSGEGNDSADIQVPSPHLVISHSNNEALHSELSFSSEASTPTQQTTPAPNFNEGSSLMSNAKGSEQGVQSQTTYFDKFSSLIHNNKTQLTIHTVFGTSISELCSNPLYVVQCTDPLCLLEDCSSERAACVLDLARDICEECVVCIVSNESSQVVQEKYDVVLAILKEAFRQMFAEVQETKGEPQVVNHEDLMNNIFRLLSIVEMAMQIDKDVVANTKNIPPSVLTPLEMDELLVGIKGAEYSISDDAERWLVEYLTTNASEEYGSPSLVKCFIRLLGRMGSKLRKPMGSMIEPISPLISTGRTRSADLLPLRSKFICSSLVQSSISKGIVVAILKYLTDFVAVSPDSGVLCDWSAAKHLCDSFFITPVFCKIGSSFRSDSKILELSVSLITQLDKLLNRNHLQQIEGNILAVLLTETLHDATLIFTTCAALQQSSGKGNRGNKGNKKKVARVEKMLVALVRGLNSLQTLLCGFSKRVPLLTKSIVALAEFLSSLIVCCNACTILSTTTVKAAIESINRTIGRIKSGTDTSSDGASPLSFFITKFVHSLAEGTSTPQIESTGNKSLPPLFSLDFLDHLAAVALREISSNVLGTEKGLLGVSCVEQLIIAMFSHIKLISTLGNNSNESQLDAATATKHISTISSVVSAVTDEGNTCMLPLTNRNDKLSLTFVSEIQIAVKRLKKQFGVGPQSSGDDATLHKALMKLYKQLGGLISVLQKPTPTKHPKQPQVNARGSAKSTPPSEAERPSEPETTKFDISACERDTQQLIETFERIISIIEHGEATTSDVLKLFELRLNILGVGCEEIGVSNETKHTGHHRRRISGGFDSAHISCAVEEKSSVGTRLKINSENKRILRKYTLAMAALCSSGIMARPLIVPAHPSSTTDNTFSPDSNTLIPELLQQLDNVISRTQNNPAMLKMFLKSFTRDSDEYEETSDIVLSTIQLEIQRLLFHHLFKQFKTQHLPPMRHRIMLYASNMFYSMSRLLVNNPKMERTREPNVGSEFVTQTEPVSVLHHRITQQVTSLHKLLKTLAGVQSNSTEEDERNALSPLASPSSTPSNKSVERKHKSVRQQQRLTTTMSDQPSRSSSKRDRKDSNNNSGSKGTVAEKASTKSIGPTLRMKDLSTLGTLLAVPCEVPADELARRTLISNLLTFAMCFFSHMFQQNSQHTCISTEGNTKVGLNANPLDLEAAFLLYDMLREPIIFGFVALKGVVPRLVSRVDVLDSGQQQDGQLGHLIVSKQIGGKEVRSQDTSAASAAFITLLLLDKLLTESVCNDASKYRSLMRDDIHKGHRVLMDMQMRDTTVSRRRGGDRNSGTKADGKPKPRATQDRDGGNDSDTLEESGVDSEPSGGQSHRKEMSGNQNSQKQTQNIQTALSTSTRRSNSSLSSSSATSNAANRQNNEKPMSSAFDLTFLVLLQLLKPDASACQSSPPNSNADTTTLSAASKQETRALYGIIRGDTDTFLTFCRHSLKTIRCCSPSCNFSYLLLLDIAKVVLASPEDAIRLDCCLTLCELQKRVRPQLTSTMAETYVEGLSALLPKVTEFLSAEETPGRSSSELTVIRITGIDLLNFVLLVTGMLDDLILPRATTTTTKGSTATQTSHEPTSDASKKALLQTHAKFVRHLFALFYLSPASNSMQSESVQLLFLKYKELWLVNELLFGFFGRQPPESFARHLSYTNKGESREPSLCTSGTRLSAQTSATYDGCSSSQTQQHAEQKQKQTAAKRTPRHSARLIITPITSILPPRDRPQAAASARDTSSSSGKLNKQNPLTPQTTATKQPQKKQTTRTLKMGDARDDSALAPSRQQTIPLKTQATSSQQDKTFDSKTLSRYLAAVNLILSKDIREMADSEIKKLFNANTAFRSRANVVSLKTKLILEAWGYGRVDTTLVKQEAATNSVQMIRLVALLARNDEIHNYICKSDVGYELLRNIFEAVALFPNIVQPQTKKHRPWIPDLLSFLDILSNSWELLPQLIETLALCLSLSADEAESLFEHGNNTVNPAPAPVLRVYAQAEHAVQVLDKVGATEGERVGRVLGTSILGSLFKLLSLAPRAADLGVGSEGFVVVAVEFLNTLAIQSLTKGSVAGNVFSSTGRTQASEASVLGVALSPSSSSASGQLMSPPLSAGPLGTTPLSGTSCFSSQGFASNGNRRLLSPTATTNATTFASTMSALSVGGSVSGGGCGGSGTDQEVFHMNSKHFNTLMALTLPRHSFAQVLNICKFCCNDLSAADMERLLQLIEITVYGLFGSGDKVELANSLREFKGSCANVHLLIHKESRRQFSTAILGTSDVVDLLDKTSFMYRRLNYRSSRSDSKEEIIIYARCYASVLAINIGLFCKCINIVAESEFCAPTNISSPLSRLANSGNVVNQGESGGERKLEAESFEDKQSTTSSAVSQNSTKLFDVLVATVSNITNTVKDHKRDLMTHEGSSGELFFMILKLLCADLAKLKQPLGKKHKRYIRMLLEGAIEVIEAVDVSVTFGGIGKTKNLQSVQNAQRNLSKLCRQFGHDDLAERLDRQ